MEATLLPCSECPAQIEAQIIASERYPVSPGAIHCPGCGGDYCRYCMRRHPTPAACATEKNAWLRAWKLGVE